MPRFTDCIYSALRSLLQAYLQTHSVCRVLSEDFYWPPVFARGWMEAVWMYNLGTVIAMLTADDTLSVKRLDVPSWARFLQILEDAGPAWMVTVLYMDLRCRISLRARP